MTEPIKELTEELRQKAIKSEATVERLYGIKVLHIYKCILCGKIMDSVEESRSHIFDSVCPKRK